MILNLFKYLFINTSIVLLAISALAYDHIHPVPTMPSNFNPIKAIDVFSINALVQMHETLFTLEDNNIIPNLVDKFNVSKSGLVYEFYLKKKKFHNGMQLTSKDVKYTLENAILQRSSGHEKLCDIVGYSDMIKNKVKVLKGIVIKNDHIFQIVLYQPNPNFLYNLVEFRFSIIPNGGNGLVGLGPYKLFKQNNKIIILEAVDWRNVEKYPKRIIYIRKSIDEAIEGFQKGIYHDLFSYPIGHKEYMSLNEYGKTNIIYTPRTYRLQLNANTLNNLSTRQYVIRKIDRDKLIKECYSGNKISESIVPPGFIGYLEEYERHYEKKLIKPKRMKIAIAKGIGNEECVKRVIKNNLGMINKIEITIKNITDITRQYRNNDLDAYIAYIECDNTLDLFQLFNPQSTYTLGIPSDANIIMKLQYYSKLRNLRDKSIYAEGLSKYIMEQNTILPLFTPKLYLIYAKRYAYLQIGIKSTTHFKYKNLSFEKLK